MKFEIDAYISYEAEYIEIKEAKTKASIELEAFDEGEIVTVAMPEGMVASYGPDGLTFEIRSEYDELIIRFDKEQMLKALFETAEGAGPVNDLIDFDDNVAIFSKEPPRWRF